MKILISQLILNIFFYKTGNVIILRLWINDQQKTAMYFHACILCVIVNAHFVHRSWSWAGILKNYVGHYVNTRTIINKLRVVLWSAKIIYILKKRNHIINQALLTERQAWRNCGAFRGFNRCCPVISSTVISMTLIMSRSEDYLREKERVAGWWGGATFKFHRT